MNGISIQLPKYISEIIEKLNTAGFEAYVVGGVVRDAFLNSYASDWDLCTSAHPEDVKAVLTGFSVIDTGIAHGTVTAVKNGNTCEITTFRSDGNYSDHRRPDNVSFSEDLTEDLKRRDFTVNAIAYSPASGVIDKFDGIGDLNRKLIKCVGDPYKRFDEDALRILRALRFSSCLCFEIEQNTAAAIKSASPLLAYVAKERICHEFSRLLCGKNASEVISQYADTISLIFQNEISAEELKINSALISNSEPILELRLAVLFQNFTVNILQKILKNSKFTNSTVDTTLFLINNKNHSFSEETVSCRKLLSSVGRERAILLLDYIEALQAKTFPEFRKMLLSEPEIKLSDLDFCGNDLISLGIKPDKNFKIILNSALNGVLERKCENKKAEILNYLGYQSK